MSKFTINTIRSYLKNPRKKWLVTAALLTILGAGLFFMICDSIHEMDDFAQLDNPVISWLIASRTESLTTTMLFITNLLSPVGIAIFVLVGASIWMWRTKEIWRPTILVGATTLAFVTSTAIKSLTERSRPPAIDMVPPLEIDYSFPSGHTLGIAVILLVLGYLLYSRRPTKRRLLIWLTSSLLGIVLIAFSRLYLGYHWTTDILASVGLSLIILSIVIVADIFTEHLPFRRKSSK
jgi:membrane-associated phospholipid phosphatase